MEYICYNFKYICFFSIQSGPTSIKEREKSKMPAGPGAMAWNNMILMVLRRLLSSPTVKRIRILQPKLASK